MSRPYDYVAPRKTCPGCGDELSVHTSLKAHQKTTSCIATTLHRQLVADGFSITPHAVRLRQCRIVVRCEPTSYRAPCYGRGGALRKRDYASKWAADMADGLFGWEATKGIVEEDYYIRAETVLMRCAHNITFRAAVESVLSLSGAQAVLEMSLEDAPWLR